MLKIMKVFKMDKFIKIFKVKYKNKSKIKIE